MSYLPVIGRDGNPHLGYMNTAAQHPPLGYYERMSDNVLRRMFD